MKNTDTQAAKPDQTAEKVVDPFDPESFKSPAIMSVDKQVAGSTLKLLVFDMGHVFVDFDWEVVCAGFMKVSGKSREDMRQIFFHCAKLGYESGKIDTAGFLAELNKHLGTAIEREEFCKIWNASFDENKEMAELLSVLREQRPLYLLSNTNEVHYEHLQGTFNVARHFNELLLSYELGCSKPEHTIYREVLKRSGFAAAECLFVDDLEPNIRAAQEVGLNTIHFKGAADLKTRLSAMGFKISRS